MLKVGLTGGIACGKSFALKEFEKLGVYGIDADEIAHSVIEVGQPAFQKVVEEFGEEILDPVGGIDRKKLGKVVFADEQARQRLNGIVHPHIFEEERRQLEALENPLSNLRPAIAMVDAALMVETGSYRRYDKLLVVYCRPEIQLRRMLFRDNISEEDALRRIASQMPVFEKVKFADYLIENSARVSDTREQIRQIYAELVARSEEKK